MRYRAVIGIEITANEIRGACIRGAGGVLQLTGVAAAPTPQGGVDAEGMLNPHAVGEAVRRVCMELDPKANNIVVGLTGCNLVARVMEIPPVPDQEVRSVLRGEMDHFRILPAGQSAFDFYRLPDMPEHDGATREEEITRVLLMGAEERLVASYRAIADMTGLNLVAVEPGSIAAIRALYPMLRSEEAIATVILSANGTDIFITHEGNLQFYRRIDTGVPELHVRVAAPAETADPQQRGGLLVAPEEPLEEVAEAPSPFGGEPSFHDPYNRQAIALLMTEVQRSIDYYVREFPLASEKMAVRFSIDSPDAEGMFGVMQQHLRSHAEMATPYGMLALSPEASEAIYGEHSARYTVAVGLALRADDGEFAGAPSLDLGVGDSVIVERRIAPRVLLTSAAASGLIFIGTIVAALVMNGRIAGAEQTLTQKKVELQSLTQEHAVKVAALDRQKKLTEAIHRRDKPVREALDFLSAAISPRACLTGLNIDTNGMISLSGEANAPRTVADVMDTINLSPALEPIRLNNLARVDTKNPDKGLRFDLQTAFPKPPEATAPAQQGGQSQPAPAPQGGK